MVYLIFHFKLENILNGDAYTLYEKTFNFDFEPQFSSTSTITVIVIIIQHLLSSSGVKEEGLNAV